MGIERSVTCSSSQILALSVWDVLSVWTTIELSKTEVNNIDEVLRLVVSTNQEVIRFDVSVDYALFMDLLDTLYHLSCANADRLQIKLMLASFK